MEQRPTKTAPENMQVWPYQPDTYTTRYTIAKYWDQHQQADQQIGKFLQQLEADGLMENTIIFYYGDHGGVLPRSKGYIYETGLHVPLVVYIPAKWQHLAPSPAGSRLDGFVSFIDFGPTVLHLAGIDVPAGMDGKPFLGKGIDKAILDQRNSIFSYADRFDEKYDLVRGLRKDNFKYIRNYQPFNVDALQNNYRYRMLMFAEWRALYLAGKLNEAQRQFFEARPAEALYDLSKDPFEVRNLAGDPAYQSILKELRSDLQQQVKAMPDLSFLPEPYFLDHAIKNPVAYGQQAKQAISRLVDIADLSLQSFTAVRKALKKALKSSDSHERYWAWIACSTFGEEALSLGKLARKKGLKDPDNLVRVRAAEYLALTTGADMRAHLVASLQQSKSLEEANLVLNTITLLHDYTDLKFELDENLVKPEWVKESRSNVARRMAYLTGKGNL